MRASQLTGFGRPPEILRVETLPQPEPAAGELLLEMLAAPINPADLNVIDGTYGFLPTPPAIIGNEGVGRVAGLGQGVEGYAIGELVVPLSFGNWAQSKVTAADQVLRLPAAIDLSQAAMLSINPPTAWAMLEDFVTLEPGDWIVQNAANSGVGRSVIQLAKARGLKTLNVVRRPELVPELQAIGADVVVTEETDLRKSVEDLCHGQRPRLGFNAVGGASALNLANALADRGTLVTYGAMARQPLKIPNGLLIFRNLEFKGYWLRRWFQTTPREKLEEIFTELAALTVEGRLYTPVHRTFPLTDLLAAVEEAAQEKRSGKILLDLRN
ncbi:zinc-dependent alcohol dehydrogenase family protein [soil metagenome]